jgi:anti-sigma regulatory factor (Ser/Thr protein kinase)
MLLAEELVSEEEAAISGAAEQGFGRRGRNWDELAASNADDFFVQARSLIEDGAQHGDITPDQAAALAELLARVEQESPKADSEAWPRAELRRVFPVSLEAPRNAREAVTFVAEDVSKAVLETACLLTSELVTNSVVHGPDGQAGIELFVQVERTHLHVAVADSSPVPARPTPLSEEGGYGLSFVAALASRWGAGLTDGRNVTWFELDLPLPGA